MAFARRSARKMLGGTRTRLCSRARGWVAQPTVMSMPQTTMTVRSARGPTSSSARRVIADDDPPRRASEEPRGPRLKHALSARAKQRVEDVAERKGNRSNACQRDQDAHRG